MVQLKFISGNPDAKSQSPILFIGYPRCEFRIFGLLKAGKTQIFHEFSQFYGLIFSFDFYVTK